MSIQTDGAQLTIELMRIKLAPVIQPFFNSNSQHMHTHTHTIPLSKWPYATLLLLLSLFNAHFNLKYFCVRWKKWKCVWRNTDTHASHRKRHGILLCRSRRMQSNNVHIRRTLDLASVSDVAFDSSFKTIQFNTNISTIYNACKQNSTYVCYIE